MSQQKIIVGMSGGVDSSVAALLLLEQGYEVEGLFMKNWEEDDDEDYCAATEDLKDASDVCETLGIKLHTINFSAEYWDRVFQHFLDEYSAGRTPNPDILCNKEIKFRAFLEHAQTLGAEKIATGHYARIKTSDTKTQLLRGLDNNKDQSYFLHALNQYQLSHAMFPIGEYEKSTIRTLAKDNNLITHDKKDSTGICFIGERRFSTFLEKYLPAKPGDIVSIDNTSSKATSNNAASNNAASNKPASIDAVFNDDANNKVIGTHNGLMYYTLGQRKGLGIGGLKESDEEPWYVVEKDLINNVLKVAQGHNHPAMFHHTLLTNPLNWIAGAEPEKVESLNLTAKIRYRQSDQNCTLSKRNNGQYKVTFQQAQRAITPGQSVVFYQGETCLGGGVIASMTNETAQ